MLIKKRMLVASLRCVDGTRGHTHQSQQEAQLPWPVSAPQNCQAFGTLLFHLFSCPASCSASLSAYRSLLEEKGIRTFSICACGARTLTLVYRERLLKQQLRRPDVQDCLIRFGYPVTEGMDAMLAWLQRRARLEKGFPHEIGCFLGYPMEDVTGFIREKGRNCKCCGMWKVYGDEAYAKHLFEKYEQCSRALCNHLEQGVPFLHILAALPAA